MTARLYGRDVGNGSLVTVTRGFREALGSAGLLEGFVALDKAAGNEEEDAPAGALARDGIFTGNLNLINAMRTGARHERHWVQVTPNSTYVPHKLLGAVLQLPNPHILAACSWGAAVIACNLLEMGIRETPPLLAVHHGVSGFAPVTEELERTRADYRDGKFRAVHFSTTDGERKGTLELLQAWSTLPNKFPAQAELLMVLDHHARAALLQRMAYDDIRMPLGARIIARGDMSPDVMSRFLCQQHVVCTPSRGEGFGLCPLQARACGVPVVTTTTTGHGAGHCHGPGVIGIHQSSALFAIDDGPDARAPALEPDAIAESLEIAYDAWEGLSKMSEAFSEVVANKWSWQAQLAPLVEALR